MKLLDISEVSSRSGVPASTLRYYEEQGLVISAGRRGLKRLFEPVVLDQLALITLGKTAGFSLDEIASMFGTDGKPQIPVAKLNERADNLDRQIEQMSALRDMIRHVAKCTAPTHMECPRFQKLLRIGGRRKPDSARKAQFGAGHK